MADDYKTKFDELIEPVTRNKALFQTNGNTEIWTQVLSGEPEYHPNPVPPGIGKDHKDAADANLAVIAGLKGIQTNSLFKFLTDLDHLTLMKSWANGDHLTSCNAFVSHITTKFGLRGYGGFYLDKIAAAQGHSRYYVSAKDHPGARPRYGDLFETRSYNKVGHYENLHVGFSLNFEGEGWWTVEGGQGGATLGRDRVSLLRKKKYNGTDMIGWIDMRKLLDFEFTLPSWMVGVWQVNTPKGEYFYEIDIAGSIREIPFAARPGLGATVPTLDTAVMVFASGAAVKLKWASESGIEEWRFNLFGSMSGTARLTGTTAQGTALSAVKVF